MRSILNDSGRRTQIIRFVVAASVLAGLGSYRVVFNLVALGNGQEAILADVIFFFSYLSIVSLLGSAGAAAVYQRLTGENRAAGDSEATQRAFAKGLMFCTAAPILIDLVLGSILARIGVISTGWWSLPLVALLGAYNFIKPLSFTFEKQCLFGGVELGGLVIGGLIVFLVPLPNAVIGVLVLCAPQLILAAYGGLRLLVWERRPAETRLSYRTNVKPMMWATLGVTSSLGLMHLLGLIGRSWLNDLDYAIYGTLLSLSSALNLLERALSLSLVPRFTMKKGVSGEGASVSMLNLAFKYILLFAFPVWLLLGIVPIAIGETFFPDLQRYVYVAALFLILYSFMNLILAPLINYNLGAGKFTLPHIGSFTGACFASTWAVLMLPSLGMVALASAMLIAVSANYLVNASYFVKGGFMSFKKLGIAFAGQLAAVTSFVIMWNYI